MSRYSFIVLQDHGDQPMQSSVPGARVPHVGASSDRDTRGRLIRFSENIEECSQMRLGLAVVSCGSFVVMLAMSGCGKQGSGDRPATVPVTAVVNYNGSPVSGATVSYIADGGENSSSGITDSSGRAAMGTFGDGDGVVPGKYKITISKVTIVGGDVAQNVTVESPDSDLPPVPVQKRQELPAKYSSPDTSGLTAEVSESGPNDATFDLTG